MRSGMLGSTRLCGLSGLTTGVGLVFEELPAMESPPPELPHFCRQTLCIDIGSSEKPFIGDLAHKPAVRGIPMEPATCRPVLI